LGAATDNSAHSGRASQARYPDGFPLDLARTQPTNFTGVKLK
jgi:hypothetical protein